MPNTTSSTSGQIRLVPIRIDSRTDAVATEAAHYLGTSRREFIADAVSAHVAAQREAIQEGMRRSSLLLGADESAPPAED